MLKRKGYIHKYLMIAIVSSMLFMINGFNQHVYAMDSSSYEITTIYVKQGSSGDGTSWSDAFGTLQEALDAAETSDGQIYEIWMSEGTYVPTSDHLGTLYPSYSTYRSFQLKNNVAIYGGFPASGNPSMAERDWELHRTILSGDLNQDDTDDHEVNKSDNVANVFYHPDGLGLNQTAILDGVTISGGYANPWEEFRRYGGGMYNGQLNNPVLRNVQFTNNVAIINGGALYNAAESHVIMHNVKFSHNRAVNGGAIFNAGARLTFVDGVMSHNVARNNGAGLSTNNSINNDIELTRVTIKDNITESNTSNGGGIRITGGTLSLTEGLIENNEAGTGGGLHLSGVSHVTLSNVTVGHNRANNGGGIYNDGAHLTVSDGIINHNIAADRGGGLATSNSHNNHIELTRVTIRENVSQQNRAEFVWAGGGGITLLGGTLELTEGLIEDNQSGNYGGGVYLSQGTMELSNVTIRRNEANAGGGVYTARLQGTDTNQLKIVNGVITQNTAKNDGGGISSNGNSIELKHVTIAENDGISGGGVFISYQSQVATLTDVEISGNYAWSGGGLFIQTSSPILTNVEIIANVAEMTSFLFGNGSGGGVYIAGTSEPEFRNVLISGNEAKSYGTAGAQGGGVYDFGSGAKFINATIADNYAQNGGGGYYLANSAANTIFHNSIIWGNTAGNGQGNNIRKVNANAKPAFAYSLIEGSGGSGEGEWDGSLGIDDGGNLDSDPLFIASDGDYQLQEGSPAIDKGNNVLIPDDVVTDLKGADRIVNGLVDLGAYEYVAEAAADTEAPVWPEDAQLTVEPVESDLTKVNLSWPAAIDVTGVTKYSLYQDENLLVEFSIDDISELYDEEEKLYTFTVNNLTESKEYLFELFAEDGAGNLSDGLMAAYYIEHEPEEPIPGPEITRVADIQQLVVSFNDAGEFANDQAVRALQLHLTAVSHFEKQEAVEKVIEHMGGFKWLLDHQRNNDLISEEAYQVLQAAADALIDFLHSR